jgi:hypothetical protein
LLFHCTPPQIPSFSKSRAAVRHGEKLSATLVSMVERVPSPLQPTFLHLSAFQNENGKDGKTAKHPPVRNEQPPH